ncbi:MAG: hypothetical protein P1U63_06750 [Coxiellaceae bacterium]|nr:hypothetical protein [Coxiellaceae bacterium]
MSYCAKILPWVATAGLAASSSAIAFSPQDFHPLGTQLNQLQYTHNTNARAIPQQKRTWQKPNVHGRGDSTLHLIANAASAATPKGNPKAFPGEMWKPKNGKNKFPGEMWKPKANKQAPSREVKQRGDKMFPGVMWKPKN